MFKTEFNKYQYSQGSLLPIPQRPILLYLSMSYLGHCNISLYLYRLCLVLVYRLMRRYRNQLWKKPNQSIMINKVQTKIKFI